MEISKVVKKIRLELNLSQKGLARELRMEFTSVNRRENKKSKPNKIARYALIEICKKNTLDQNLVKSLETVS